MPESDFDRAYFKGRLDGITMAYQVVDALTPSNKYSTEAVLALIEAREAIKDLKERNG